MSDLSQFFPASGGGGGDIAEVPLYVLTAPPVSTAYAKGTAAVTTTTYSTLLDVAGPGVLRGVTLRHSTNADIGNKLGLKLTLDGVAYEMISTSSGAGMVAVTTALIAYDGYNRQIGVGHAFKFNESLKIEAYRTGTATTMAYWTHSMDRT